MELADRARGVSAQLRGAGVSRNDIVAIACGGCMDFASAFFGVLHAGATPLPLAPTAASARADADRAAAAILDATSPAAIVACGDELERAAHLRREAGVRSQVLEVSRQGVTGLAPAPQAELALLQFTSGSTGKPRGVKVSFDNLESNVAMCWEWYDWDHQTGGASWLPLQHDMGLIGVLLVAICAQRDLWQMKPADFLLDPLRWIECFGDARATIAVAPTFGYSYAARRLKAERLEGLDFSDWRTAVVGAERVIPEVLNAFAALLGEFGFHPKTFCPAYGMAEATLVISSCSQDAVPEMVGISLDRAKFGQPLSLAGKGPVTNPVSLPDESGFVVCCGRPVSGVDLAIVGEGGSALPDGVIGEISVRSPSVAQGYWADQAGVSTRFQGDRLLTGDAGFLLEGELYVLGRLADSLKVRGTYVYAEDLEIRVAAALDLPLSRCVVITAAGPGSDCVAVLVEARELDLPADRITRGLRPLLGTGVKIDAYRVARHALLRTTSGKPRRRLIAQKLASGELEAELAFSVPAEELVEV